MLGEEESRRGMGVNVLGINTMTDKCGWGEQEQEGSKWRGMQSERRKGGKQGGREVEEVEKENGK